VSDPGLRRPSDIRKGWADPARAERALGWRAKHRMPDVVRMMLDAADGREA
jgi:GDPmannose 4,6-dehydratase